MNLLLYAFCGALSLLILFYARPIGALLGVFDDPDGQRKVHTRPTPLVGGLAVVFPLTLTGAVLAVVGDMPHLYGTLTLALIAYFLIGLADDYRHLPPLVRLAACVAVALVAITVTPLFMVEFLSFSFYAPVIFLGGGALLFTLACIVGLTNALNMADGQNGLVAGLSLMWTLLLLAYAPVELQPFLIVLLIGLAATLAFNFTGVVFLGDSGSYGISFALAAVTIFSYNVDYTAFRADVVMLLFLVPVLDCIRLILARLVRNGSPFRGDRNHLHHILQRLMRPGAALAAYWALVGVPCGLALAYPQFTLSWVVLCVAAYGAILWVGARLRARNAATAAARDLDSDTSASYGELDD